MARAGPSLEPAELRTLAAHLHLLIDAGVAGRAPEALGESPEKRLEKFNLRIATDRLPMRVSYVLGKYAMPYARTGDPELLESFCEVVDETKQGFTRDDVRVALIAVAYWMDPTLRSEFAHKEALAQIEHVNAFVNAYVQSISTRALKHAPEDELNRHFAAMQRRRNGIDSKARSPFGLVKHLSSDVRGVIANYAAVLQGQGTTQGVTSNESYVLLLATALGRSFDPTLVAQLHVTLSTLSIWRTIKEFPALHSGVHPVLGLRQENDKLWNFAAKSAAKAIKALASPIDNGSSATGVQMPSRVPIMGNTLDAASLHALQHLVEYCIHYGTWLLHTSDTHHVPAMKFESFDAWYRDTDSPIITGGQLTSTLPNGLKLLFAQLQTVANDSNQLRAAALDCAKALGDTDMEMWCLFTLETAIAWRSNTLSSAELGERDMFIQRACELSGISVRNLRTAETSHVADAQITIDLRDKPISISDDQDAAVQIATHDEQHLSGNVVDISSLDELLEPFALAHPTQAREFFEFGRSIVELVEYSQSIREDGKTASGWWSRYHRNALNDQLPTTTAFLQNLSPRAMRLVDAYARVLRAEDPHIIPRANELLSAQLQNADDGTYIYSITVGLAVSAVWANLNELSSGDLYSDSLLGAAPFAEMSKQFCKRAQIQLEWGLGGLLRAEQIAGV